MTQTRYGRFLSAPEGRVHTVYDRVKDKMNLVSETWKKNRYFEGENHD